MPTSVLIEDHGRPVDPCAHVHMLVEALLRQPHVTEAGAVEEGYSHPTAFKAFGIHPGHRDGTYAPPTHSTRPLVFYRVLWIHPKRFLSALCLFFHTPLPRLSTLGPGFTLLRLDGHLNSLPPHWICFKLTIAPDPIWQWDSTPPHAPLLHWLKAIWLLFGTPGSRKTKNKCFLTPRGKNQGMVTINSKQNQTPTV